MKRSTRRSLRRAWRTMTWPLSAHIALALGTGEACGQAARVKRFHTAVAWE
jgi:hypothetical protein